MMGKLSQREVFLLFGALIGFSLVLFLVGIWIGMNYSAPPEPVEAAQAPPTDEKIQEQTAFYDELVDGKKPGAAAETSDADSGAATSTAAEPTQPPSEGPRKSEDDKPTPAAPRRQPAKKPEQASAGKPASSPAAAESGARYAYTVQIGATKSEAVGKRLSNQLKQKGYEAILVEPGVAGDGFYHVSVGEFAAESEAKTLEARLKADGFRTFIKRVRFR